MQFLYNEDKKNTAAHIWTDGDTACRMLSTGGLRMGNKKVHNEIDDRRICLMCQNNLYKFEFAQKVLD